jgi:protein-S-isoprenylcysteine O-methyltransferase Ste14
LELIQCSDCEGEEVTFSQSSQLAGKVAFYAVIACWWVFALTFWLRKTPPPVQEAKRDWTSLLGLLLQGLAYAFVWFDPLRPMTVAPAKVVSPAIGWTLAVLAILIAAGSTWLVNSAARQLGKQWALAARLVEGHELIQAGPYRLVRNPIYTGMLGMLLATGLVIGRWIPLAIAIVIFFAGTWIRIRSEEKLLRQAFGQDFEAYARNVSALIPGIY